IGFTAGMLLGGTITQAASWRWGFLINVPLAAVSMLVVPRLVTESRGSAQRRIRVRNAIAGTLGLGTPPFTIAENPLPPLWASPPRAASSAAAWALRGASPLLEGPGAAPLTPAGFLHRRATLAPNALQLLLGTSAISTLFLLTLYTQQVLRYTPLKAGLAYLP